MGAFVPIHQTVEDRAREVPDAVAVADEHSSLTYRRLVRLADELAAAMIRGGVRPGDVVAVQMQRGSALVVALLAVSRAGAGALMMDVDGPTRWLARFVDLVRPVAWITHRDRPDPPSETEPYRLDATGCHRAPGNADQATDEVAFAAVGPEDLACLVQTSGSTGEPKLVLVPHRTWAHASATQQRLHGITRKEHGAWLFPSHTNVSVSVVIWPFLAAGGRLSVPPPDTVGSPEELAVWVRDQGITQFFAVAPLAEAMAKLAWPPSSLRLMLTGSDRVREWSRYDLPFEVGNWYGANEVNIVTSSIIPWNQRITSATASQADRSGPPPIGRSWSGATWRVVDTADQPVPPGEVGELLVGGEQLAIGYHSPRATAQKFLPDAESATPGARIYSTGDLVRVRSDGALEHCGRVDEQVKINGMRVEMAEVERAILGCPGVKEAAVAAMDTPSGRPKLVGYLVTDSAISDAELRKVLVETLPSHMVPAAFVRMERLPRNRGDKIDRRALPRPTAAPDNRGDDATTAAVASVLGAVLSRDPVDPDDNFLLLGGDSLLATRAARELTRTLGYPVSAEDILLNPTPGELADLLRSSSTQPS